jgi:hypothetical protein
MRALAAVAFALLLRGQSPPTPGISGEIGVPQALKFLYGNFDEDRGGSTDGFDYVTEYAVQDVTVDSERRWFLYTVAYHGENQTCHACELMLGAAVFAKQGDGWILKAKERELGGIGSYGAAPYEPPKTVQWGKTLFGVVVEDGWTGYGTSESWRTLFGFDGVKFRVIFGKKVVYGDAPWSYRPPGSNGVFDIVIATKDHSKRAKDYALPGVYRYDGKEYRHVVAPARPKK